MIVGNQSIIAIPGSFAAVSSRGTATFDSLEIWNLKSSQQDSYVNNPRSSQINSSSTSYSSSASNNDNETKMPHMIDPPIFPNNAYLLIDVS
jgi:hypothetical protein